MGCGNCGSVSNGQPAGCNNNGSCATGGCNKLNTFDWLSSMPIPADQRFDIHEISFKNGSRKEFFKNTDQVDIMTGDLVAVETDAGYDVGRISLSGELVRLQMKKKKVTDNERKPIRKILRKAREVDLDRMMEARAKEGAVMLRARQIAMQLKLDMKIGEVEYQGDKRKATFYYTAEDRVDFRELIRTFASEFRVKIDMRQIGSRQEAGKIGGIGSCGRELCCSTWLTDFKSVSTAAARYQNLAINQSKLSGQCGRLKCCLNFELDTYMEANKAFPKRADILKTENGDAYLAKTDIFNRLLFYTYKDSSRQYAIPLERVKEILAMNKEGKLAAALAAIDVTPEIENVEFVDDAKVSLSMLERGNRRRNKRSSTSNRRGGKDQKDNRSRDGRKDNRKDNRTKDGDSRSGGGNKSRSGGGSKSRSGGGSKSGGGRRNDRRSDTKGTSQSGGNSSGGNRSRGRGRGRTDGKQGGGENGQSRNSGRPQGDNKRPPKNNGESNGSTNKKPSPEKPKPQ